MKKIYLAYIKVSTFSGQTASTLLIKKLLANENYEFIDIPLFPVNRSNANKLVTIWDWLKKTIRTLNPIISLLFSKNSILYINLGQSYFSFIRVLWWYIPIRLFKFHLPIVISLNGHDFVAWKKNQFITRIFSAILKSAVKITVVGETQKTKLIANGIDKDSILIVPNTIDLKTTQKENAINKQKIDLNSNTTEILFLSLLVESKGYPEYLESLLLIAKSNNKKAINAVICGPLIKTKFCNRFNTIKEAEKWILNIIDEVNSAPNSSVHVKWIKGAKGEEKSHLFNNAHIFVLPTYYPNEAQPLVILEALSSGCAIITSDIGELPSTVNSNVAQILDFISPETISKYILNYIDNENLRLSHVSEGLSLFTSKFSTVVYKKNWLIIFNDLTINK